MRKIAFFRRYWMYAFPMVMAFAFIAAPSIFAETQPVSMTVTVVGRKNTQPPPVRKEDVQLYEGKEQVQVADWHRSHKLLLAILIDDSLDRDVAIQWNDLKAFINAQPADTYIAVGYARNGAVTVAQDFTPDHAAAAKALRIPLGGQMAFNSPYLALTDWLKRWPNSPELRAERNSIILISSGVDYFRGSYDPQNPDVDQVIEHAQKQNTNIWSVYYPSSGHFAHRQYPQLISQGYMSRISEETGAESYALAFSEAVTLKPYFDEIQEHLNNQYLLTFVRSSGEKKGKFVHVRVNAPDLAQVEFMHQTHVFLPPSR